MFLQAHYGTYVNKEIKKLKKFRTVYEWHCKEVLMVGLPTLACPVPDAPCYKG